MKRGFNMHEFTFSPYKNKLPIIKILALSGVLSLPLILGDSSLSVFLGYTTAIIGVIMSILVNIQDKRISALKILVLENSLQIKSSDRTLEIPWTSIICVEEDSLSLDIFSNVMTSRFPITSDLTDFQTFKSLIVEKSLKYGFYCDNISKAK